LLLIFKIESDPTFQLEVSGNKTVIPLHRSKFIYPPVIYPRTQGSVDPKLRTDAVGFNKFPSVSGIVPRVSRVFFFLT